MFSLESKSELWRFFSISLNMFIMFFHSYSEYVSVILMKLKPNSRDEILVQTSREYFFC